MVVKLPLMTKHEIDNLIQNQCLCRIAFRGTKYPYIAPFQYVVINNTLYFHFTDYGNKMKLLQRDNAVCVEIEDLKPDLSEYRFVSLRGKLTIVHDANEKQAAIHQMAEGGRHNLSPNFLAAHGINKEEGWTGLMSNKSLIIMKLAIRKTIGVKSPTL
jgi:nitroimidazol reductase NimA-like FMN-containing flavoprotein (pyridoxamine 5'-phosphate oxidase superfamily)